MQDIDFDELDKAVSSVMDTAPTTPVEPTAPVAEPAIVPEEKKIVSSPATRRSTGRFMDVVHPSSDMRTAMPPRPVAIPTRPTVTETAPSDPVEPEEVPSADVLDSPFLTDAKVEKRPLGAFSDALHSRPEFSRPALELLPAEVEDDSPTEEPVVDTSPVEVPTTEEPSADALELADFENTPDDETAEEQKDETPVESAKEPEVPAPKEVTVAESAAPMVAASIPQQYKEQPASIDQPSGAIYDTENYHQPLTHPTKKSSGWWVILWIVGLIIVGGGIGVALYYFVLPQL